MKAHTRLLLGLVLGVILGTLLHPMNDNEVLKTISESFLQPLGQIFIGRIFMVGVAHVL